MLSNRTACDVRVPPIGEVARVKWIKIMKLSTLSRRAWYPVAGQTTHFNDETSRKKTDEHQCEIEFERYDNVSIDLVDDQRRLGS